MSDADPLAEFIGRSLGQIARRTHTEPLDVAAAFIADRYSDDAADEPLPASGAEILAAYRAFCARVASVRH